MNNGDPLAAPNMLDPSRVRLHQARRWSLLCLSFGTLLLGVGALLGWGLHDHGKLFYHSYLVSFAWGMSISLGGVFWVTLQYLVRAQWSLVLRRLGEIWGMTILLVVALALPIIGTVVVKSTVVYPWGDGLALFHALPVHHKTLYLNRTFFLIRCLVYFSFWSLWAWWLWSRSRRQDSLLGIVARGHWQTSSALAMIVFGITVIFAAIDFVMSLNPMWLSAVFGVYYFAGCVVAIHAVLILSVLGVQCAGSLQGIITVEHLHDLGKLLLAFIAFWAYVAFSQFLLIGYGNIPEETSFYHVRFKEPWFAIWVFLFIAHFAVPFLGLLSKRVKRSRLGLGFFSVWMLVVHWVDLYWLVMPSQTVGVLPWGGMNLCIVSGVAALLLGSALFFASKSILVPLGEPSLSVSVNFENV